MSILSAQTGVERTAVPFRLVAADGSDIDRSLIEVTSESVILDSFIVEQPIYAAKELVINTTDLVSGHVPEGYVIKRITAEPATLTIAGSNELIESLNELHLVEMTAQQIDVTNASDTLMRRISLVPPSGAVYLSSDTVMVTVEIASK
jgi:YbbR domain-containing protein